MGMPRFSLKELLLGTTFIAIVLATLFSLPRLFDPYDDEVFTPRAWKWSDELGRGRMSRDLLKNHLKSGLTQAQVEALIGEADYIAPHSGAMAHAYPIRSSSALGGDFRNVCVLYDSNGKVIYAEIQ
jgi:hypothetical protein